MTIRYPHIAARIFNTPLMIHPGKLQAIVAGLSPQLGIDLAEMPQALTTAIGQRAEGGYRVVDDIAVLDIYGILSHRTKMQADSSYILGYQTIAQWLDDALQDRKIEAIVLNVDSPGGEVSGAFDLADKIHAAGRIKPIYSVAGDLAASAGYLIAGSALSVSVTNTGQVGSIGVVTCHVDMSIALEKAGYKVTPIFAGSRKIDGNPYQPLPDDVAERVQADINHYYRLFIDAVAQYRPNLTPLAIRETEAEMYIGENAVTVGLADRVETPDQLLARITAEMRSTRPSFSAAAAVNKPTETKMADDNNTPVADPPATNQPQYLTATVIAEQCLAAGEPALGRALINRQMTAEQLTARLGDAKTIRGMAAAYGLEDEAERLIVSGIQPDQAGRLLHTESAEQDASRVTDNTVRATVTVDQRDKFRQAGISAVLSRCGAEKPDTANPYRGMRLHELARASAVEAGIPVGGMMPDEMVEHAMGNVRRYSAAAGHGQSTSDFPIILEGVVHRLVLMGYQAQPTTWERFCKIGDVTDFREWKRMVPGLLGNLDEVNERGEYLNKNLPDAESNSVAAKRRGNIISITPEVIINDDLGYIQSLTDGLGRLGPRTIERHVYTLLESNPVLKDGIALFHADHKNLAAAGAAPSVDALDAAGSAMAEQTAPGDDKEYLDITPAVAVVHRSKRGNMITIVNAEYDPDTANKLQKPNKVQGIVADIVASPRLSPNPWYLFADPNMAPVIEVVFLNGQREPRVIEQEAFRTGGLSWRIEMPFGVGAIGYRGAYKNPGAA